MHGDVVLCTLFQWAIDFDTNHEALWVCQGIDSVYYSWLLDPLLSLRSRILGHLGVNDLKRIRLTIPWESSVKLQ